MILSFLGLLGCGDAEIGAAGCVSSFDCTREEICISGRCAYRAPARADAGARDAGTQLSNRDAGTFDVGCPDPIVSETGAWCSLAEAVDRAPPGSILLIPAGILFESVVVDSALVLRGTPGTLGANTVLEPVAGEPAIRVRSNNVVIENLIVQARGGIGLDLASSVTVRDVEVRGATGIGILVNAGAVVGLERVRVAGVTSPNQDAYGILVAAGARATVTGSIIEDVQGNGIEVKGGLVILQGSEIRRSKNYGVHAVEGSDLRIERGSRILDSDFVGVGVFESQVLMRESESSGNGKPGSNLEDGLWLASPTSAVIDRCTFNSNNGYGIYCSPDIEPMICSGTRFAANGRGQTNCARCQ